VPQSRSTRSRWFTAVALLVPLLSCVVVRHTDVSRLERPATGETTAVQSPVKAHLLDGSTVVYRVGVTLSHDTLAGTGVRYSLLLGDSLPVTRVPLDSVLGMESFRTAVDPASTFLASTLATGVTMIGVGALAVAIFGSCPTFYADSAGVPRLEAEGFSYSVAPLFEARDVDVLQAQPDADDTLRLEVRNEALETHYINHLELIEVRRGIDEAVFPDQRKTPVAVSDFAMPAAMRDRAGSDLRSTLAAADDRVFHSDSGTMARASADDLDDYIDLVLPTPTGVDSVAVVLRMKNSLLNTVMLYDLMLGAPGLRSLDWVGKDLQAIGPAAALGRWYAATMGMRVAVRDSAGYHDVGRIPDTGPIAWSEVAVVIPVPRGDSLRIRLSFVADDWRIDRIRVARRLRRPGVRTLALAQVLDRDGRADASARASLGAADDRYLETHPGDRFSIGFATSPGVADSARTYLLASQGYYIEWVRGQWVRAAAARGQAQAFVPSNAALVEAVHRWRGEQADYERRFAATRIPVR